MLRGTLEAFGQWGAVRVCPENVLFVDVSVSGKIVESTGAKLALQVTVKDSNGRVCEPGSDTYLSRCSRRGGERFCSATVRLVRLQLPPARRCGANCRRDWWAPQVVDVEGRTLKLTGTAEEQYREWRKLLHEMSYD